MKIVNDATKFKQITEPIETLVRQTEDRIYRFILKLKNSNVISEEVFDKLRPSGSGPGILYGKPKIHKKDFSSKFQYRPILAAYNLASYKLAKFLVPIFSPFTNNQFTIQNSKEFAQQLSIIFNADNLYMASFDIEILFTNIPLQETSNICIDKLFTASGVSIAHGFTLKLFQKFIHHAVQNSFFIFDSKYYKQIEGMGMGSPLGPSFANVFMCHHESIWIDECPLQFRPVKYFRYLDDTFLLFRQKSHCDKFLAYLNSKHSSIRFTVECEENNCLSFLDVLVKRENKGFSTSVFRKNTFSGLGMSFYSHCCKLFKINGIKTLLHRAFNVCSSNLEFRKEISFLRNYFFKNGFPHRIFNFEVERFMNRILDSPVITLTVSKKPLFVSIPYFGHKSVLLVKELNKLISENFLHIEPKLILTNNHKIGNFFKYKDTLPKYLQASLVYKYGCPQSSCGSVYVGSSICSLLTRGLEHMGTSQYTNLPLPAQSRKQSAVRDHSERCGSVVSLCDFSIVSSNRHATDLRILESLYILTMKPDLNDKGSAFPLKIA